jgi:transcriptional regulator with XRE-family HTH domain
MVTRIGPKKPVRLYIAEWRNLRKMNQQQLADRIGSTKSSISRWETTNRDITLGALGAIAEALSCDVEDLFRDPARPSADALLRNMNVDDSTRRRAFRLIEALKAD